MNTYVITFCLVYLYIIGAIISFNININSILGKKYDDIVIAKIVFWPIVIICYVIKLLKYSCKGLIKFIEKEIL